MKRNTKKNREKLVAEIIDQMNLDTMIEVLRDQHESFYESYCDRDFDSIWKEVFGED